MRYNNYIKMKILNKLTILSLSANALKIDKLYLDGGAIHSLDGVEIADTFKYNEFT